MSTAWPSGERAGGRDEAASLGDPVVARMLLGARLRRLRQSRDITRAAAGYQIRGSPSKISRLEHGRVGLKERDIADLLGLYGVDDQQRAGLLALSEQANAPTWWAGFGEVVAGWFEQYLGLEHGAAAIRNYEVQFVHGLLQTADYARAVILLGHQDASARQIEQRVQLRLARQQRLLTGPDPPTLWAVVDEAALRRPLGGPKVMGAQLQHLVELADRPGITVQIMPLRYGGHPAAGGSFTILRFARPELPDLVYVEQLTSAIYLQDRADTGRYLQVMDRLSARALPPASTAQFLQQILTTI